MAYEQLDTLKRTNLQEEHQEKGFNFLHVGVRNRLLVLKSIALNGPISRAELANQLGLTRTTLGNIVSELTENDLVQENDELDCQESSAVGRRPILLSLSNNSPCILGILIKRYYLTGVVADLSGKIITQSTRTYEGAINAEQLISMVCSILDTLLAQTSRRVCAIGVSSIGPIDEKKRLILTPPNFHGISNLPICDILEKKTGIPCYLINDANAGALAEKLYGRESETRNFIYVHIMNGIGSGYVLDHRLYSGDMGQSGEIGHSTIDFSGPVCDCGNVGCLELYANDANMNKKIRYMQKTFGIRSELFAEDRQYTLNEILHGVDSGDHCAISALDEFCNYLSAAMTNAIKFLNVNRVIVGYSSDSKCEALESVLDRNIRNRLVFSPEHDLSISHSSFGGDAPLYGAIALIAELIFDGRINWLASPD